MAKTTYTADGETKIFNFDFSFYQIGDIVVSVNGAIDSGGFAVQIGKPSDTATFPYTGGAVSFAVAPAAGTTIEISREFVMARPCDYNATIPLQPTDLNRDFNFNLENMRDFRDLLNTFANKYENITNIPDIADLITKLNTAIDTLQNAGDTNAPDPAVITALQESINDLQTAITNATNHITELENAPVSALPTGADYILKSMDMTNYTDARGNVCATYHTDIWASGRIDEFATGIIGGNYTNGWYRKTGTWCEQGGECSVSHSAGTGGSATFIYPIPMIDNTYSTNVSLVDGVSGWPSGDTIFSPRSQTEGGVIHNGSIKVTEQHIIWQIFGLCG